MPHGTSLPLGEYHPFMVTEWWVGGGRPSPAKGKEFPRSHREESAGRACGEVFSTPVSIVQFLEGTR
jgi:hypothetical protein